MIAFIILIEILPGVISDIIDNARLIKLIFSAKLPFEFFMYYSFLSLELMHTRRKTLHMYNYVCLYAKNLLLTNFHSHVIVFVILALDVKQFPILSQ